MSLDEIRRRYRAQKYGPCTARQKKGGRSCAAKRKILTRTKVEAFLQQAETGCTLEEAAATFGWAVSTAKSHLRSATGSSAWPPKTGASNDQ